MELVLYHRTFSNKMEAHICKILLNLDIKVQISVSDDTLDRQTGLQVCIKSRKITGITTSSETNKKVISFSKHKINA